VKRFSFKLDGPTTKIDRILCCKSAGARPLKFYLHFRVWFGGYTMLETGDLAEAEARERAARHNELVSNRSDRVMNVVCVKTAD
jgi:hypothetical protein